MLVAVSDLHLDDGTCGKSLSTDAFLFFRERLEQLAYSASLRLGNVYRPVESIDLLLLGDIFELIHTTLWLQEGGGQKQVRPWAATDSPALAAKIEQITRAILAHNGGSLAVLRGMADGAAISLPPATLDAKPARESVERIPIPVNIHYMAGNHDWFYHLPGELYERSRQLVINAMGLKNTAAPIPYEPQEWDVLERLFAPYRLFARHGDCYDKWSYNAELGRNAATLGDALSVELLNRFPEEVENSLGDVLPAHFYRGLHEVIHVRPMVAAPLWIGGQFRTFEIARKLEVEIKRIWNLLVEEFLELDFVRSLDKRWNPFDSVDELALLLRLTRWTSIENFSRAILLIKKRMFRDDPSFTRHALTEPAFTSHQADYIVYGHTHHHETIPLDSYPRNGRVVYQFLVNTGTWRSYYDLTRYHPEQQKFLPYQLMSYLAFFTGDERHGRRYEAWLGNLV